MLFHEFADETRVPQLRRNAQVFAAPHQRVRFASLGRRRHAFFGEILLLASRLCYESVSLSQPRSPTLDLRNTKGKARMRGGRKGRGDLPSMHNKRVLPRNKLLMHHQLAPRRQSPTPGSKRRV